MKYKAVLLDADDTIFDFKASERSAFCRTAEHFGFSPELYPHYHRINDGLWKALERKEITKEITNHTLGSLKTEDNKSSDPVRNMFLKEIWS